MSQCEHLGIEIFIFDDARLLNGALNGTNKTECQPGKNGKKSFENISLETLIHFFDDRSALLHFFL